MPDQMLFYDNTVKQWIQSTFGSLVPSKPFDIMIGTPDRAFAEFVTPTGKDPAGRPRLPRAALTLGDPELDPSRFNSNDLRKLGYPDGNKKFIRKARYPTPINIPYTLNLWTEYQREMNLYVLTLMDAFRFQYLYLDIDLDTLSPSPVYGIKQVGLFANGSVMNTGDVEPAKTEKTLRRSFNFTMKAWIWDFNFVDQHSIQEVVAQFYNDRNLTDLLEMKSTPQRHTWIAADGVTTWYGPILVDQRILPIIPGTLLLDAKVGGNDVRAWDDRNGNLVCSDGTPTVVGTVNYSTGAIVAQYATPPDASTDITVAYYTKVGY